MIYYLVIVIIILDLIYLLGSLLAFNSLFHILALFMVGMLQLPQLKIFPSKEKRYETAPQEMLYIGKSRLFITAYC